MKIQCRSRSKESAKDINDEIDLLVNTYGNVEIISKATESSKGEIKVLLENSRYENIQVKLCFYLKFEFDYPSSEPTLQLISYKGLFMSVAGAALKKAQEIGHKLSMAGESSVFDMVAFLYTQVENTEENLHKMNYETNLKETYLEKQQAIKEEKLQVLITEKKNIENQTQQNIEKAEMRAGQILKVMRGEEIEEGDEDDTVRNLKRNKIESYLDKTIVHKPETGGSEKEININPEGVGPSRFLKDFKLISILGQGAFGTVYKVRNNLDGNSYAVKRMVLNYSHKDRVQKILMEVQLLSQLNHMNIVRYNQAWTEIIPQEELEKIKKEGFEGSEEEGEEEEDSYEYNPDRKVSESDSVYFKKVKTPQGFQSEEKIEVKDCPKKPDIKEFEESNLLKNKSNAKKDSSKKTEELKPSESEKSKKSEKIQGSPNPSKDTSNQIEESKNSSNSSSRSKSSSSSSSSSSSKSSKSSSSSVISNKPKVLGQKADAHLSEDSKSDWDPSSESHEEKEQGLSLFDNQGNFQTNQNISMGKTNFQEIRDSLKKSLTRISLKKDQEQENMRYLYIQMEACELETLRDFIDKGFIRKEPTLFNKLMTQILDAFTYIHDLKMIHRDVKPSNIFLDKKNNIRLGDFGLATKGAVKIGKGHPDGLQLERLQSKGQDLSFNVGTPIYMSPEQEAGGKYDMKADMWSLGIIVFEMVYGPFSSESERIHTILKLRNNREFPTDFDSRVGPIGVEVFFSNQGQENNF